MLSVKQALIVGLEVPDLWGTINSVRDQLHRSTQRVAKANAKIVSISAGELDLRSNYQYFQRNSEVDMSIAADAEATLPYLIEACKKIAPALAN